jgi:serine/threonine protein kinase
MDKLALIVFGLMTLVGVIAYSETRDPAILFFLFAVMAVGAVYQMVMKSLSGGREKPQKDTTSGLARSAHLDGLTATGLIMGTPEYMAPEQVAGKKVDERADIYSLGIILYELFSGRVPFTGDSPIAVGFKQLKEEPQPPRKINPQIPGDVEKVILKALQKDPVMRYRSVTDLKTELQRAMPHRLAASSTEEAASRAESERIES